MTWIVAIAGVPVVVFWWRVAAFLWERSAPYVVPEAKFIWSMVTGGVFVVSRWTLYLLRHKSCSLAAKLVSDDLWRRSWRRP